MKADGLALLRVEPFPVDRWIALDRAPAPTFQARPAWSLALADAHADFAPNPLACTFADGTTCVVPLMRTVGRMRWRIYSGTPLGGYTIARNADGTPADAAHARAAYRAILQRAGDSVCLTPWPLEPLAADDLGGTSLARTTAVVDLADGAAAALARMDGKFRRMAGQAQRRGVTCARSTAPDAVERYYAMLEESAIRWGRRAPTYPKRLLEALVARGGDDVQIWFAWFEEQPIAGGVILYGAQEMNFWSAAMRADFGTLRPSNALNVSLIEAAAARGVRWYNLGESEGLPGVARFKEGLGAVNVAYRSWRAERRPYALYRTLRTLLGAKRAADAQREG